MTGAESLSPNPTPPATTVTELLSGILDDAQKLVRQQIDLAKAEFKEELAQTRRASEFGGIGLVLMTIGGLTLVAFLVNLLHEHFQYSMWASCLIIGSILLSIGIILLLAARNVLDRFSLVPEKTLKSLRENLTWKTEPQV
ncbi:MAG TPA: phage holin family protein [Urbifossiella sp.]